MTGAVVAVPFLTVALLTAIPVQAGTWVSFGATLLAFALACGLTVAGQASALGATLALLATFVAATAAWGAVHDPRPIARAARVEARWRRAGTALFQVMLGGALLATLADNLTLGWIGLEVGTVAAAIAAALPRTRSAIAAGWQRFLVGSAALGLVLAGIAVLAVAASAVLGPDPAQAQPIPRFGHPYNFTQRSPALCVKLRLLLSPLSDFHHVARIHTRRQCRVLR